MASSKILSTVRNAPTLVDGLLVADSLKDILSGLCDLANQQQEEIKILKEQLKNFIPKSEVISMIEDQKMKLNESRAFYSREISSISAKMNQFQNQFLPIASSMKKTKEEVEMKFKEFDNNIENHTQLLFEQYQMTAKSSKRQLDDMKDMLENVTSAHSETRHKLDQLEVLDGQATNARLDEIELKLNKFENNFSDFSEKVTRNETMFKDNNKSTTRILEKLTQDVAECLIVQRAFHESTKGEIEIKDAESLIAAVERNSRRLDGVDMNLSHIKLDQQNVTDIVKSYETVLVTFKHHIYDMTLKQQQTADKVSQKLAKICDFVSFVGRNLDNLYGFCVQGTEKSFLLSETTAKSFDDVRRVLQMISKTTTIPDFNNFTISTEDLENLRSKISSVHADNDPNDYAARFLSLFYLENQNKKRNYHVNFEIDNTKCQKDDEITQDVDLTNGPNETENSHTLKKEKSFTEKFEEIPEIPKLTQAQITLKNVECIKDLFFKAEPLRLHVNDIEDKLSNLIADFKKATAASDNKINQLNQRFEEKMDSDYIVRVFDKCNKQVKQLTEIVTRLEKKVDDRNTRSVNSLGIDHTISNTSSANNINYNKNRNSQIEAPNNNNENSPISMPEKSTTKKSKNGNINIYISPEPAIVSRHTSPTRAQLSSLILSPPQGQHSKAYSNHGQHGKQVHHTPNTTKTKPKSQMQQLQTYQKGTVPAKSAEITPRGRYKIKLPGINKPNEQALASTSLNSPHRE